ncbi:MAG: prepilin-type N-terminal cleavage/methylation domain-containing protein, partial [Proteobacteria bacterium]|nr:prepilin-type N-terminal cleavage/methylation domain-containing protein [Pseudomonadota bacterium]
MKNGMPSILRDPAMKLKQRGVGLVEIMIALTVALFLLLGLSSIFITTKATYKSQNSLAGLQ